MTKSRRRARPRRFLVRVVRATGYVAATGATVLGIAWWAARPATPDAFYDAPSQRPAEAGALLRSESFTRTVPQGAQAWRILYTTTRADDSRAVASAIVLTASRRTEAPRPVIAWAHGTTGVAPGCAPSVMAKPFAHVPAIDRLISEDWVYVATDYVGLGTAGEHAYLIGDDAARAVLDAVRAARRLPGLSLDNRVVVWGHSQGGNSALWTGMRAPDYAPDVNLQGVAALAPASDLRALVASGQSSMFGKIVSSYLMRAYPAVYADVDANAYVGTTTRLIAHDIAGRCVGGWETLFSVLETTLLPGGGIFAIDPTRGALGDRLQQNTPNRKIAVPLLIAQGQADDLVLPDVQTRYVAARCAAGQPIDYRAYAGRDHLSLVAADSPLSVDLVAWTRDRLASRPATTACAN